MTPMPSLFLGRFERAYRLRWWNFRRRREHREHLERIARTELHITLDGQDVVTTTFETAYLSMKYGSSGDSAVGLQWLPILHMTDHHGQTVLIELRLPLPVKL